MYKILMMLKLSFEPCPSGNPLLTYLKADFATQIGPRFSIFTLARTKVSSLLPKHVFYNCYCDPGPEPALPSCNTAARAQRGREKENERERYRERDRDRERERTKERKRKIEK